MTTKETLINSQSTKSYDDLSEWDFILITTQWYKTEMDYVADFVYKYLNEICKVPPKIIRYEVPGSHEIPFAIKKINNRTNTSKLLGFLTFGILMKGETLHFEQVSSALSTGIMSVQLSINVPIINGVISCFNIQQAHDRIYSDKNTLPYLVNSVLHMAFLIKH